MKKVLEGELLSIVHRVLQMKDTDVDKLYVEAKELYEKLQILKFYQDNLALGLVKDITEDQLVEKLSAVAFAQTSEVETPTQIETNRQEEEERSQIPTDLLAEDYPIVVEAEKEVVVDFEALPFDTAEEKVEEEEGTEEEEAEIEGPDSRIEEEIRVAAETDAIEEEEEEELGIPIAEIEEITAKEESTEEEDNWTEEEENEEGNEEEDDWTEEDVLEIEEELADQAVAERAKSAIFEEEEEETEKQEEEEVVFAPLTANQREDNPFEGFDFGEIEFIRVEDIAKEDTIVVDDSMFERVVADAAASTEAENQPTASFFAQQIQEEEAKEEEEVKEETKGDNQQNMLFNLDQVSVREPRIVKKSINDIYRGTIMVGLNDRIAFEKHLFANSSEDFNRVLSQLNTVSTYDEARSFVEHLVKPEYNNWEGKEEYAERFMTLIEKRFE